MPKRDPRRISESDLLEPTLRLAASRPDGWISTTELIDALAAMFEPAGEDAQILDGRNDTKFSQIVRNMVSHKGSATNIIGAGYAQYINGGLQITGAGRAYLRQIEGHR